jgi:hypothetical protein
VNILRVSDHVKAPGFRLKTDGPNSGEWFRDAVLVPQLRAAISKNEQLAVQLDGVAGYGSSFLEEAFGGLIRNRVVTPAEVERHLRVIAGSPLFRPYEDLILRFIRRSAEATAA